MHKIYLLLTLSLVVPQALLAQARGPTEDIGIRLDVPELLFVDVEGLSVTFPSIGESNFNQGFVISAMTSDVSHGGNVVHSVRLTPDVTAWDAEGHDGAKPVGDFKVSVDGGAGWAPMTPGGVFIVEHATPGFYPKAYSLMYRVDLSYKEDTPGEYTLPFTFTVVSQ